MPAFVVGLLLTVSGVTGCARQIAENRPGERHVTAKTIEEVLKEHTQLWMSMPGVIGAAIGECDGNPCIRIFVTGKSRDLTEKIPTQLEGFPVILEATDEFRARE